jgi:hypothetical protein
VGDHPRAIVGAAGLEGIEPPPKSLQLLFEVGWMYAPGQNRIGGHP